MTEETPKPYDIQSQPAILSSPLSARKKPAGNVGVESRRDRAADSPTYDAPEVRRDPSLGSNDEERRLGVQLARALESGGYHPVVLFGTAFSGKTSLLMSLFATLESQPRLKTGIVLCDPILGSVDGIGQRLHEDARKLFDVGTQAFIAGEPTPKTNVTLPFFIPVEVRPAGRPAQRFAFLESNGEWYRPLKQKGQRFTDLDRTAPKLKETIESFISAYQGSITFIYLTPFTQRFVYGNEDTEDDKHEIAGAELAIKTVVEAYDRTRATHRLSDKHLMLVTKWDAASAREKDRAASVQEDRAALQEFCHERYPQALSAFEKLNLEPGQRQLNAYVSGIINKDGRLQLKNDDDLQAVVNNYPPRLWNWLYGNAREAIGERAAPLFPEGPKPPAIVRAFHRLLDFASGR